MVTLAIIHSLRILTTMVLEMFCHPTAQILTLLVVSIGLSVLYSLHKR